MLCPGRVHRQPEDLPTRGTLQNYQGVAIQQMNPHQIEERIVAILAPDGLVVGTVDIFRYGIAPAALTASIATG
jgi:hypothetical protein